MHRKPLLIHQPRNGQEMVMKDPSLVANQRYNAIKGLLDQPNRTLADVKEVAKSSDVSVSTIYSWLARYDKSGLAGLGPKKKIKRGVFPQQVEEIINSSIQDNVHKGKDALSVRSLHLLIQKEVFELGFSTRVSYSTIARRYRSSKTSIAYTPKHHSPPSHQIPSLAPYDRVWVVAKKLEHHLFNLSNSLSQSDVFQPWLVLLVDEQSYVVLGVHVSAVRPTNIEVETAMRAMVDIYQVKDSQKNLTVHCVPEVFPKQILIPDRPNNLLSAHLRDFCIRHNIKPSHYSQLPESLVHWSVAFAGMLVDWYVSRQKSYNTLAEVESLIQKYVYEHYPTSVLSFVGLSPLGLYHDGRRLVSLELLHPSPKRHILHREGIKWKGTWYNMDDQGQVHPILDLIRRRNQNRKKRVNFQIDPRDIRNIWVFEKKGMRFHAVYASDGFLIDLLGRKPSKPVSLGELNRIRRKKT